MKNTIDDAKLEELLSQSPVLAEERFVIHVREKLDSSGKRRRLLFMATVLCWFAIFIASGSFNAAKAAFASIEQYLGNIADLPEPVLSLFTLDYTPSSSSIELIVAFIVVVAISFVGWFRSSL